MGTYDKYLGGTLIEQGAWIRPFGGSIEYLQATSPAILSGLRLNRLNTALLQETTPGVSSALRLRKNGVDLNLPLSIPGGASYQVVDLTDEDEVVVNVSGGFGPAVVGLNKQTPLAKAIPHDGGWDFANATVTAVNREGTMVGSATKDEVPAHFILWSTDDTDADGLPDDWERRVIAHDLNDDIKTLADVRPEGDLDGNGLSHLQEFQNGTHPQLDQGALMAGVGLRVFTRME